MRSSSTTTTRWRGCPPWSAPSPTSRSRGSCSATSPRCWPTAQAFTAVSLALAALSGAADVVVGVEARGFLLGAAAALTAGTGIVPVRKAGKLPRVAASRSYDLEYGTATLELPADAVEAGARVFVIDDVLATGGTAAAACDLVIAAGAEVVGFAAMIELVDLGGRARLGAIPVHALLAY